MAGCTVELEHGLDERQANQIAALLDSNGLSADKQRDDGSDGWKIVVAKTEMARAYRLLEANDLPRRDRRGMSEVLSEKSLLPSQSEEQARMELARSVELERTLEHVPGVMSARVHLALPRAGVLDEGRATGRASVLLRTQGTPSITDDGVKALVAGSIVGVTAQDVAVVFTNAQAGDAASHDGNAMRASRSERGPLTAVLASGMALLVLLGGALVWTALRLSSQRTRERSDS
jgi:type III secretion protein J